MPFVKKLKDKQYEIAFDEPAAGAVDRRWLKLEKKNRIVDVSDDEDEDNWIEVADNIEYFAPEKEQQRAAGEPPKVRAAVIFGSLETMQQKIDGYFRSIQGQRRSKSGEPVENLNGEQMFYFIRPPTIEGLADALDMSTDALQNINKLLLYDVADLPYYSALRKARQTVEIYWAEGLAYRDIVEGSKFVLATMFARVTPMEKATIKNRRADTKIKQAQLSKPSKDDAITINIVRKQDDDF